MQGGLGCTEWLEVYATCPDGAGSKTKTTDEASTYTKHEVREMPRKSVSALVVVRRWGFRSTPGIHDVGFQTWWSPQDIVLKGAVHSALPND